MKSRYDFGTDYQYYEYLVHYYIGMYIISGDLNENCIKMARDIVERIKNGE